MTQVSPAAVIRHGLRILAPLSVALTVYLYLFPLFQTCAFPLPVTDGVDTGLAAFLETAALHSPFAPTPPTPPNRSSGNGTANDGKGSTRMPLAPFRLLALGDPQLEGDTSIPNAYSRSFPHLRALFKHLTFQTLHSSLRQRIRQSLHDTVDFYLEDIPNSLEAIRKRIDLFGNDFYLAHIYRTLHWWTRPTHVSVLGDLVGSQWLDDAEFDRRSERYWTRVFRGGDRVPDDVARYPADDYDLAGILGEGSPDNETAAWTRRVINVAGNHDIGYAGDINYERLGRFERAFGKANYELRFELPLDDEALRATVHDAVTNPDSDRLTPELRIVILNDMNLDTPALSQELQDASYRFINSVINTASAVEYGGHFTLMLTHVPLYKPAGVCADEPFFAFHDHDGTLREQNQLSVDASKGFLEGVYGMSGNPGAPAAGRGRPGVILNGHDHVGCDTWHFINQTAILRPWEVRNWDQAQGEKLVGLDSHPGIREITVRSMMGDFGGNAGLLSLWFDYESWQWKFEYATCPMGTHNLWWVVHILDLITIVAVVVHGVITVLSALGFDVEKRLMFEIKAKKVQAAGKAERVGDGDGDVKKPKVPVPS